MKINLFSIRKNVQQKLLRCLCIANFACEPKRVWNKAFGFFRELLDAGPAVPLLGPINPFLLDKRFKFRLCGTP